MRSALRVKRKTSNAVARMIPRRQRTVQIATSVLFIPKREAHSVPPPAQFSPPSTREVRTMLHRLIFGFVLVLAIGCSPQEPTCVQVTAGTVWVDVANAIAKKSNGALV